MSATVLLVDDEVRSLDAMRRTLEEDFEVLTATGADEAREQMARREVHVILCDQRMPGTTGVEFLREARERWPDAVRIVISGYTDSEDIIAGINEAGIWQYILKPWVPDHLLQTVRSAAEARTLQHGLARLDLELRSGHGTLRAKGQAKLAQARSSFDFARLVRAPGSPLDALCEMAQRIARHDLSVLILGESGTGKELMARAIHYASPRLAGPFVVENCAAIPDTLLESELFGHKRGAFTGAVDDHVGLFQRAHGGTVFLDEIGETSPAFQVKLLRVLQEGELRPVGSTRAVPVDVRVIAATHRDLEADVRAGRFREDLYYRIAGVTLAMPPLRERPGDIVPIAERILVDAAAELALPPARFDDDARAVLMSYPWPGNIRELRNEIARALALSDGPLVHAAAFSRKLLHGQAGAHAEKLNGHAALPASGTLAERLDSIEAMVLRETLLRHRWNKTRAAQELGLSRVGLRAKLQRFGLEDKS
ncbi:MAG: sigma-54-dependent Fis family transcriptional regulator [Piscinibacter sp.]|uniref:sigma-54-dependent transcriptional regulator n=1 Tax=Piscinibacter sp. TaxID=1903157 RepID=UPI001B638A59|nr:sigma-54 dependent transcriptional regulator [Piscinibacter sp.]MBP5989812.1 sigma-54-dependent Fis family transcriptional regulator [Piscinibacter sp.]MBP6027033.1 sigma-54-dependent Fis family transcriptional regulator [Piscinibacter sp.]